MFTLKKFSVVFVFAWFLCVPFVPPGNADGQARLLNGDSDRDRIVSEETSQEDHAPGDVIVVFRTPAGTRRGDSSGIITADAVENGTFAEYMNTVAANAGAQVAETYGVLSEYASKNTVQERRDGV